MNLKRILETIRSYNYRTVNFRLVLFVVALSVLGVFVISSATDDADYVKKQVIGIAVGVFVMILMMLVRYDFISRYYWLIYLVTLILLGLVLTPLGKEHKGAQRWLGPSDSLQIQPSEIAKILLIIFFASLIAKNQQSLNTWRFIIIMIILAAIPLFLVYKEPDLSTSVVLFVTICAIIFTSGLHRRFIKVIVLIALPIAAAIIALIIILPADHNILDEYQYNRLVGFYEQDNEVAERIRYQQENSVIAIANGSLSGKGLHNDSIDSVKNAEFISEPQTDFILTLVGEELGFVGSMAVVLLLLFIVIECFRTGFKARDLTGKGIAIGMGSLIGVQSFINLGVVTMMLPNTGVTLPFVSYGLSSLIFMYMGIGIVLNIGLHRKITF